MRWLTGFAKTNQKTGDSVTSGTGGLTDQLKAAIIHTYTGRGNNESSKLATPQQKRTEAYPQAPSIEKR